MSIWCRINSQKKKITTSIKVYNRDMSNCVYDSSRPPTDLHQSAKSVEICWVSDMPLWFSNFPKIWIPEL
ncbi:uncharacterized protein SPAPADRAFT_57735, partial [Spathaspora passalidarum NRRL Y-27907]